LKIVKAQYPEVKYSDIRFVDFLVRDDSYQRVGLISILIHVQPFAGEELCGNVVPAYEFNLLLHTLFPKCKEFVIGKGICIDIEVDFINALVIVKFDRSCDIE
jgi:hypothetical protein